MGIKQKVIVVNNLDKYQHYRDRNIIWIKLYVDILQDYKFCQLRDNEKWIFLGLILLAVKNDNQTPLNVQYISQNIIFSTAKHTNRTRPLHVALNKMIKLKLISIKLLSSCYQDAIPIREDKIREEEKRVVSSKKTKPYFRGDEMRKAQGKFWVIPKDNGKWLEFAGKESEITWK